MKIMRISFVMFFVVLTCAGYGQNSEFNTKNLKVRTIMPSAMESAEEVDDNAESKFQLITYKNLRLYPVIAKQEFLDANKDISAYTTLKEAMEKNEIKVTEKTSDNSNSGDLDGAATVNSLFVENTSKDTIFLMAGEVVSGGKQDRVLAEGMMLPPNSGKIDISVFCVEKNRWSGSSGNFDGYFAVSQNSLRKVVVKEKEQRKVWAQVDSITTKNEAVTGTNTYTAVKGSKIMTSDLKGYESHFEDFATKNPGVIGVVVVTGDKVLGCDMFATPDLFQRQFPNLLRSYAMEALTNGAPVAIEEAQVDKYFNQILGEDGVKEEFMKENGTILKNRSREVNLSSF